MKWSDHYRIGVPHLDAQHQGLFAAVNRIMRIIDDQDVERSQRACVEAAKYLKNYTLQHFADEEAYQREIAYPGYPMHKAQHDTFAVSILEREREMEASGYSLETVQNFAELVTSWLVRHIMDSDQAIAPGKPPAAT